MLFKDRLKADFDYDVRIASGAGSRADPFVVEPCTAAEASLTQYKVLQGLGRGRREIWRLADTGAENGAHSTYQGIGIEAVEYTDTEIITERRRIFFDIAAVEGRPEPLATAVAWRSPQLKFDAPFHLEWLHLDSINNNAAAGEPLDVSLFYSGIGAKATLHVYQGRAPANLDPELLRNEELVVASEQLEAHQPKAKDPWGIQHAGSLALRYYILKNDLTAVAVARKDYCFVKLRLTFFDDLKMRELMTAVTQRLVSLLDDH